MKLAMMFEIYACIPGVAEFQEAKVSMEIEREVVIRKAMYGLEE